MKTFGQIAARAEGDGGAWVPTVVFVELCRKLDGILGETEAPSAPAETRAREVNELLARAEVAEARRREAERERNDALAHLRATTSAAGSLLSARGWEHSGGDPLACEWRDPKLEGGSRQFLTVFDALIKVVLRTEHDRDKWQAAWGVAKDATEAAEKTLGEAHEMLAERLQWRLKAEALEAKLADAATMRTARFEAGKAEGIAEERARWMTMGPIVEHLDGALAKAIEAERDACAKIAEDPCRPAGKGYEESCHRCRGAIAEDIRARGKAVP